MTPLLVQLLRSRWFAVAVHVGLWLLFLLAVTRFGGKAPALRDAVALSAPAQSPAPVSKLERFSTPAVWPPILRDTNQPALFFTKHFVPKPVPPPPAPTTRKIEVVYNGYYDVEANSRQVFLKVAGAIAVLPVGAHVSTNWLVGPANIFSLTLTNSAGQTTLLPLNEKKEIEVPIQ
jgi:hypothetical protein